MSPSIAFRFTLLACLCIALASGCGSQSTELKSPQLLKWYTTTSPLPIHNGEIKLTQNADGSNVFLVVEVQFPAKSLWVKGTGSGIMQYEHKFTDSKLRTPDDQLFTAVAFGGVNDEKWSQGSHYTETPSEAKSRIKLAFVIPEALAKRDAIKLEHRDLEALTITQEKKVAAGPLLKSSSPAAETSAPPSPDPADINRLLTALRSASDRDKAREVTIELLKTGEPGLSALVQNGDIASKPLIDVLEKESSYLREAIVALGRIRNPTTLVSLLANERSVGKGMFLRNSTSMGSYARSTDVIGGKLLPGSATYDLVGTTSVGYLVQREIEEIGEPMVPALLQVLQHKDMVVRERAVIALGVIQSPSAVPGLSAVLKNKNEDSLVQNNAARALGAIGTPEAVSALIERIPRRQGSDSRAMGSYEAVTALGSVGPLAKKVVPDLIELLKEKVVFTTVYETLGEIGPEARAAVPALLEILQKKNDDCDRVAIALGKIGPESKAAVPLLIEILREDAGKARNDKFNLIMQRRVAAARSLAGIGPEAKAGCESLRYVLAKEAKGYDDWDVKLRVACARALWQIEASPLALSTILEMLEAHMFDSGRSEHKRIAAEFLTLIGPPAKAAVPSLIRWLGELESDLSQNSSVPIITALGSMGPDAQAAVPALVKRFKGCTAREKSTRAACLAALQKIDPGSAKSLQSP